MSDQIEIPKQVSPLKAHHMPIKWFQNDQNQQVALQAVTLREKTLLVGRVGIMMLACGTGAWRVRDAMNHIAWRLDLVCTADIGFTSIHYTCFDDNNSYTQILTLPASGVNTDRLQALELFVQNFAKIKLSVPLQTIHARLDNIQNKPGNYQAIHVALAAALACASFIFLLGGGLPEMLCVFVGAGLGNYVRRKLSDFHITTLVGLALSVATACITYLLTFELLSQFFHIAHGHEAGYIGAMLFVIPGFPFITSFLDLSKLDMRSGLERLNFAIMITGVASLVGWLVALAVHLRPENFMPLGLSPLVLLLLRIPASFCGVFGFSIMFNSPKKMALAAACIGAVANPLRLELVDFTTLPPSTAAFIGALVAGILASLLNRFAGFPRISLTVPAIVIMVPGLFIYRAVYNIGINQIGTGALWLTHAILIILFLPLGLFVARVIFDRDWRHFN